MVGSPRSVIIAVDGPLASGKGTIARALGARFGVPHLDTGALYRAVAVAMIEKGLPPEDADAAEEVARTLDVNAIDEGKIRTAGAGVAASAGAPDRVARLGPTVPQGRAGTAEEVAEAVVWLLSDAARYCAGSIIDVSGGR